MKQHLIIISALVICLQSVFAQTNPAITAWIQNHDGATGHHYISGNPTPIDDGVLATLVERFPHCRAVVLSSLPVSDDDSDYNEEDYEEVPDMRGQ